MKSQQPEPNIPAALIDLKRRIHIAQQRAALAVNRELALRYWQIGRDITVSRDERLCPTHDHLQDQS